MFWRGDTSWALSPAGTTVSDVLKIESPDVLLEGRVVTTKAEARANAITFAKELSILMAHSRSEFVWRTVADIHNGSDVEVEVWRVEGRRRGLFIYRRVCPVPRSEGQIKNGKCG